MEKVKCTLVSLWWITWLGLIGAFFMLAAVEHEYLPGRHLDYFSLTLVFTTGVLWTAFFVVDSKARGKFDGRKNQIIAADLLTLAGTFLAVFTWLGILFLIYVAPRIP